MHLELASSERHGDIKEGDVVHLECHVRASPLISRLFWRHNVSRFVLDLLTSAVWQHARLDIKGKANPTRFDVWRHRHAESDFDYQERRSSVERPLYVRCKYVEFKINHLAARLYLDYAIGNTEGDGESNALALNVQCKI